MKPAVDAGLDPSMDAACSTCEYAGKQLEVSEANPRSITDPMTGRVLPLLVRFPMGPGPYPVVIWSHGGALNDNGHRSNDVWSREIAANGYIVIHLAHVTLNTQTAAALCMLASVPVSECMPGNATNDDEAPFVTIARPRDMIAVLDALPDLAAQSMNDGGPMVDLSKVVVAGWSAGSRGPVALLGAKRRLTPSIPEFAMPDPRPVAAIALSPAGVGYFGFYSEDGATSWDGMRGPLFVSTGANDVKAEPPGLTGAVRRTAFDNQPMDGTRQLLYSNLAEGTGDHGTYNLADLTSTDPRLLGFSRALRSAVLAFLDANVHDDATAKAWLASDRALRVAGDAEWTRR